MDSLDSNALLFHSPQTGSTYVVVAAVEWTLIVCYRTVDNRIRVRIQSHSGSEVLKQVSSYLAKPWGEVKNGDHISVTLPMSVGPEAIGDATRALLKWKFNNIKEDD